MKKNSILDIHTIVKNSLYAIVYDNTVGDVLTQIFDNWNDVEYLDGFFEEHESDLTDGFYGNITIENAIEISIDEAEELEEVLLEIAEKGKTDQSENLQTIFKPLHNNEAQKYPIPSHQKSKVKPNNKSWLRIYAIRIEPNIFIVTGGAIKLTKTMNEREHLLQELGNLQTAKEYLIENQIIDSDSITDFLEI